MGPLRPIAASLPLLHSPCTLQNGRGGQGEFSGYSVFLKVAAIISGLHELSALLAQEEERANRTVALASYFNTTLNTHNCWAIRMLLCELLFFVNVVFNIFLIDTFLGGEFSTFGLEVVNFVAQDPQYRMDPMSRYTKVVKLTLVFLIPNPHNVQCSSIILVSRVFPRMTKCIYEKFGQSGTIEVSPKVFEEIDQLTSDPRCTLPAAHQCCQ